MDRHQRDLVEEKVALQVVDELLHLLPFDDEARDKLIGTGQKLLKKMDWDTVVKDGLLPMLERISNNLPGNLNGNGS